MKRKGFRIICLLLTIAAMLAGCTGGGQSDPDGAITSQPPASGQSGAPGSAGMFVQSIVSPQADIEIRYSGLYDRGDGSLLLIGMDETFAPRAYTSAADGGEWTELANSAAAEYVARQREAGRFPEYTVASDGTWWLGVSDTPAVPPGVSSEASSSMQAPRLVKVTEDGQPQEFDATPAGSSPEDFYTLAKILPGPGGAVYALLSESLSYSKYCWVAFDGATGKETAQVALNPETYAAHSAVIKGSTLYVPDISNNQIEAYSMLDGGKTGSFSIPKLDFGWESICFDVAENGDFCYADMGGIHRIAQGGTLVQDMVNGTRFVFSAPGYWGSGFVALAGGSYLLLATDNVGPDGIYRFVFDANATVSAANTLTVWTLADSYVLRAAVSEYNHAHPDVYVTVEYGRTGDATGAADDDVIRTLNTRLLAGDVPDVLILDGLPVGAYIERGLLTDLAGMVDTSGCYENIMRAYSRDGKVYGVPALFQMPVFIANADGDMASGVSTLAELAQTAAEPGALHYGSYEEMFESLYMAYSSQIFPAAASVDEAALLDFLENTKAISDTLELTDENSYVHGGVSNAGIMPRQGLASFIEGNSRYAADILWEPVNVSVMYMMSGAKIFTPLPGGGYIPVCGGAIPAGAANAEKAASFIELMVQSESVQELRMEQGFSVKIGQHLAFYENAAERNGLAEGHGPAEYDWDGLVAKFSGPAITERTLYLTLYDQAERLYRGEISPDEAADAVIQNTKLYFEERA